jgi:hypothetical protein
MASLGGLRSQLDQTPTMKKDTCRRRRYGVPQLQTCLPHLERNSEYGEIRVPMAIVFIPFHHPPQLLAEHEIG